MAGFFENVLGTFTGGLFGDTDQQRSSDRLWEASRFVPYNVSSTLGTGSFNGNEATGRLNPRYNNMANRYRLFGNSVFNQMGRQPNAVRNRMLNTMRNLALPDERRDIADMQTMLFNKGLLGSTSGSLQMNSLLDTQSDADLKRILSSIDMGNRERESLFDLGSRAYGADIALQGLPLDLLRMGSNFGSARSGANYTAGRPRYEADTAAEESESEFLDSLVGSLFGGFF